MSKKLNSINYLNVLETEDYKTVYLIIKKPLLPF
jgi:hypothetical protein